MNITIGSVQVYIDEKASSKITPKFKGTPESIHKVKKALKSNAMGLYGNTINIENCFAVDFIAAVKLTFPNVKIPISDKIHNPKFPIGAMP